MNYLKLPNRKKLISVSSIAVIISSLLVLLLYSKTSFHILIEIIIWMCSVPVFIILYLVYFNINLIYTQRKQNYRFHIIQSHREIFDALTEAIWFIDPTTGSLLDVNQTTAKMFGYNREQLLLSKIEQLTVLNELYNREHALELLERTMKGEKVKFEWMFRRANGNIFTTENIIHKVNISGTELIIISTTDISEKIRIEASLAKKETRFKDLFQQAGEGIIICNERGMILEANEALSLISDYEYDDLIGSNVSMLFQESVIDNKAPDLKLISEGKTIINETKLIRKDQVSIHIEINIKSLSGGLIQIFIRDISKRKIAELKLTHSEKNYREIVENVEFCIVKTDLAGNITFANRFANQVFDIQQRLNTKLSDNFIYGLKINKKNFNSVPDNLPQLVLAQPELFENISAWVGTQANKLRYFMWRSKIITDSENNPQELVLIGIDKTETKLAFDQLAANEQLLRVQNQELIKVNTKYNELNNLLAAEKDRIAENENRKTEFINVFSNKVIEYIEITNALFEVLHNNYHIPESEIREKEGIKLHNELKQMLSDFSNSKC